MTVFLPLVTGTRCQGLKASRRSLAVRGSTSSDISADNNMLGHLCTSVQIRLTFGDKEGKGGRTRSLALKLLYRVHHQVCSKLFFKVFMAFLQADGPIPISKNSHLVKGARVDLVEAPAHGGVRPERPGGREELVSRFERRLKREPPRQRGRPHSRWRLCFLGRRLRRPPHRGLLQNPRPAASSRGCQLRRQGTHR